MGCWGRGSDYFPVISLASIIKLTLLAIADNEINNLLAICLRYCITDGNSNTECTPSRRFNIGLTDEKFYQLCLANDEWPEVETLNFSFEEPPTLSGEDALPGFVLELAPVLNF